MIAPQLRQKRAKTQARNPLILLLNSVKCAKTFIAIVFAHCNSRREILMRHNAPNRVSKMIWRTFGAMSLILFVLEGVRQNFRKIFETVPEKLSNINDAPMRQIRPPTGGYSIWRKSWRLHQSIPAWPRSQRINSLGSEFSAATYLAGFGALSGALLAQAIGVAA